MNSGALPYTYQWFSEAPPNPAWAAAKPYTLISSGNLTSYLFVTSNSTALGTWTFMVQKIDGGGESLNSTVATVKVNSALSAPSVSASPDTVDLGQSSTLASSAVTTGTSPYTYQWFSEAPGNSSYTPISGATDVNYTLAPSTFTAAGNWSFMLQLTDITGATVNSTAATLSVNTPAAPPTSTATAPPPEQSPAATTIVGVSVVAVAVVGAAIFMLLKKRQKMPPSPKPDF